MWRIAWSQSENATGVVDYRFDEAQKNVQLGHPSAVSAACWVKWMWVTSTHQPVLHRWLG